jgi:hypothetical protein
MAIPTARPTKFSTIGVCLRPLATQLRRGGRDHPITEHDVSGGDSEEEQQAPNDDQVHTERSSRSQDRRSGP